MRIVQISDTHLGEGIEVPTRNLERVIAYVNETLRPELVIHTGDVVALSPDSPEDREHALSVLAGFEAPLLVLPGNHDIGEGGAEPWMGLRVNSARVAAHRNAFGADRFSRMLDGWLLVGLSSELFGTDLEEESEQWDWLAGVLAEAGSEAQVALFLHQPLWWPADRTSSEVRLSVPVPEQERLLALPGADRIRVVTSGHLHRFYHEGRGDIAEVWAPSTAFTSAVWGPELGRLGIIEWELSADRMTPQLRVPDGLESWEAGEIPGIKERLDQIRELVESGGPAQ